MGSHHDESRELLRVFQRKDVSWRSELVIRHQATEKHFAVEFFKDGAFQFQGLFDTRDEALQWAQQEKAAIENGAHDGEI